MITLTKKELQDLYLYVENVPMKYAMPIFQFLKSKEQEAMEQEIKKESDVVVDDDNKKPVKKTA